MKVQAERNAGLASALGLMAHVLPFVIPLFKPLFDILCLTRVGAAGGCQAFEVLGTSGEVLFHFRILRHNMLLRIVVLCNGRYLLSSGIPRARALAKRSSIVHNRKICGR